MIDAKEVKDLVEEEWNILPNVKLLVIQNLLNISFEDDLTNWVNSGASISTAQFHTGLKSVTGYPSFYVEQSFTPVAVNDVGEICIYVRGDALGAHYVTIKITYTDNTYTEYEWISIIGNTWEKAEFPLANLSAGKNIKTVRFTTSDTSNPMYLDDASFLTNIPVDMLLQLDEYNPNFPAYQIVFINRPERTMFVAPNVIKHEQDIVVEIHVKHIRMDPDNVDAKRTIFKSIKEELSRIFNTYRFDEVGNVLNVSAWSDNKLPHGFGAESDPLEFVTRLTLQIFYYEATDGTKIGLRVSKVTILDSDLLGLIDAQFIDTNPWVHMQIPKGPLHEQHLLGPHMDGEVSTHDYASLHQLLYTIPIVEGSIKYPILVSGTKLVFSTDIPSNPQFTIVLIDDEGTTYTYDFYNVRIKQVELQRTNTSGTSEAHWRITWMADYVYYTAGGA